MPRRYTPVKTRYLIGGLTQEQLASVACPTTLDEAAAVPASILNAAHELGKEGLLGFADSESERELREFLEAQRWRGADRDSLKDTLKRLEQSCQDAIREAKLVLTVRRGAHLDPQTKRQIGGSRHPVGAWEYILMLRLRMALEQQGLRAGAWSRRHKEGLLLQLFRLCAKLAGREVSCDLSRARRVEREIRRRTSDVTQARIAVATGPQPQSPKGMKLTPDSVPTPPERGK